MILQGFLNGIAFAQGELEISVEEYSNNGRSDLVIKDTAQGYVYVLELINPSFLLSLFID